MSWKAKRRPALSPNVHSCSTRNRSGFLIPSLGYRPPPPTLELQIRTWLFTCLFGTPEYQNDALYKETERDCLPAMNLTEFSSCSVSLI